MIKIFLILFFLFVCISFSYSTEISTCSILSSSGYYNLTADILNSSVNSCLNVSANNVVLDCQGHLVQGNGSVGNAIDVTRSSQESANVTIKNCRIENWVFVSFSASVNFYNTNNIYIYNVSSSNNSVGGIKIVNSINITLDNITVFNNNGDGIYTSSSSYIYANNLVLNNNWKGINFDFANNNFYGTNLHTNNNTYSGVDLEYLRGGHIINLTSIGNRDGIDYGFFGSNINISNFNISYNLDAGIFYDSHSFTDDFLENGYIQENGKFDVEFENSFSSSSCDEINFINVTGSGGRPIEFYHTNSLTLQNKVYSELILCKIWVGGFTLRNITIDGSDTLNNNALILIGSNNVNIIDNISSNNNNYGVQLLNIYSTSIYNSTFINNNNGIYFYQSANLGFENKIYNNFFNNTLNMIFSSTNYNFLNNSVGGNYYYKLDGTGYSDLCSDLNSNGVCDYSYKLSTYGINYDYLPKTHKLGNMLNYSISLCQKLSEPGDYILANDILNENLSSCLEVIFSNISLDCQNNFLSNIIVGGNTFGVNVLTNNFTIMNCNIYNWTYGVYSYGADFLSLINISSYNNNYNFYDVLSNNISIFDSNFYGGNTGIYLSSSSDFIVKNNNIYNNIYGFQFQNSYNNTIFENNIYSNTRAFYISNSKGSLFYNNTINSNVGNYIFSGLNNNNSWNNSVIGNTWLLLNNAGFSQTCLDESPVDGFCDSLHNLTSNNYDYLAIYQPYAGGGSVGLGGIFPFSSVLVQVFGLVLVFMYLLFV
ncbi:MAG: right-handed parallel beta-helix repeat-containing protein, partial [Nanoarchaeota archaeon]|nr:right-handed parallel beta-helix repeat-containing protein [Nanoarchaeota archaeon]